MEKLEFLEGLEILEFLEAAKRRQPLTIRLGRSIIDIEEECRRPQHRWSSLGLEK